MRQMDLTEGVIWKKLLVYAWPVVLSSLLQSAYAITDLIVAGWFIGKDGISAINNASQVMQILTQVILGITTGGNILMGQYFGAKDRDNRLKTNTTIFGFAILAGLIMTGVIYFLSRPILVGLKAPTLDEATAYLQICALGIIPIFGYNALSACCARWATPGSRSTAWRSLPCATSCWTAFSWAPSSGVCGARPWRPCWRSWRASSSAWPTF